MSTESYEDVELISHATDIVSSYVSKNNLAASQLPDLIIQVCGALRSLTAEPVAPEPVELKPAVAVKKSVTPDFIICLEDGLRFKSLKRHLRTKYDMTPEEYRAKWGLASDYPMVAPNYAEARSNLAKQMGLGQQRKKPVPPAPKGRDGRKPKAAPAAVAATEE